jgi:hypothetical protein
LNNLVRWGQIRQSLWLLERHANPNLADERGWTAVHRKRPMNPSSKVVREAA